MLSEPGAIEVANQRSLVPKLGWKDWYVGRPSRLGNPFKMDSEADRDTTCDLYAEWLREQIEKGRSGQKNAAWEELKTIALMYRQGASIRLICWCAPKRCHADTIKLLAMNLPDTI